MKKNILRSVIILIFSFLYVNMYGQENKRKFEKRDRLFAKQETVYLADTLKLTKQQAASLDEIEISVVNKRSEAKKIVNNELRKQKYTEIDKWHNEQVKSLFNRQQYILYLKIIENSRLKSQNKNAEIRERYRTKG